MAHDHHHDHDAGSYYVGQLCMVGICGALAGVAVVLWLRGGLWFLAPKFQQPVLLGGLALLALVAIRALSIWFSPPGPIPTLTTITITITITHTSTMITIMRTAVMPTATSTRMP